MAASVSRKSSDGRRRAALRRLGAAALAGSGFYALACAAVAANGRQGIVRVKGAVSVNGKPAALGQVIGPGQKVVTGADGEVVFIVGQDAFLQRPDSEFVMEAGLGVAVLRFLAGKILAVFGKGAKQLRTPTAAIGIRGTACYIEAEPARTYFCLCYGEAELAPLADPAAREILRTQHHERPLYIGDKPGSTMLAKAPVINHSDAELTMLEALVGRKPPFEGTPYPFKY